MSRSERKRTAKTPAAPPRTRDALAAWLAAGGVSLSAYLWAIRLFDTKSVCLTGAACDYVQTSVYSVVAGIPVPALGLVFYGAALAVALRPQTAAARSAALLPLASAGLGASAVFTGVQHWILRATCSTCLLSAVLSLALLAAAWRGAPRGAAGARSRGSGVGWRAAGAAVLAAAALSGVYALSGGPAAPAASDPKSEYALALATHLKATGAVFYGAVWCPHCADQKKLFGRAAAALPYIECDERTPGSRPAQCQAAGVRAFPTWIIGGQKTEGVLTLDALARASGFRSAP